MRRWATPIVAMVGVAALVTGLVWLETKGSSEKLLPPGYRMYRILDGGDGVVVLVRAENQSGIEGVNRYPSETIITFDVAPFEEGHLIALILDQARGARLTRYVVVDTSIDAVYAEFRSESELKTFWASTVRRDLDLTRPARSIEIIN